MLKPLLRESRRRFLAILFGILCITPTIGSSANDGLEDGVKAAYLFKFLAYIEWPPAAFTAASSTMNICLLGSSDQFNSTLKKIVHGENINNRAIAVIETPSGEKISGCHILYAGTKDNKLSSAAIASVRGSPTLTISDNPNEAIIGFLIVNNRVRFNIDSLAAAENNLVISSRLMSLAVNVKRGD